MYDKKSGPPALCTGNSPQLVKYLMKLISFDAPPGPIFQSAISHIKNVAGKKLTVHYFITI